MPHCQLDVKIVAPPLKAFHQVAIQSSQGCDVENLDSWSAVGHLYEYVQDGENRGFCLSCCRWGNQKNVLALEDLWYRLPLRLSWALESPLLNEPSNGLDKLSENTLKRGFQERS